MPLTLSPKCYKSFEQLKLTHCNPDRYNYGCGSPMMGTL